MASVLVMVGLGGLVQRVGGADTRDHVLALGVDEPLAVELVVAGGRIAAEGDTGCGGVAHVAEHHALHVDSGAPVIRNLFDAAVSDCALAVPALEHATDGTPKLSLGGVGELDSENFLDLHLELVAEVFEFICGDVGVGLVALGVFQLLHHAVQLLAYALAVFGLDALGLLHHDV